MDETRFWVNNGIALLVLGLTFRFLTVDLWHWWTDKAFPTWMKNAEARTIAQQQAAASMLKIEIGQAAQIRILEGQNDVLRQLLLYTAGNKVALSTVADALEKAQPLKPADNGSTPNVQSA